MRGIALLATVLLLATAAAADSLTYRNDRFGTRITFPVDIFDQIAAAPENGDGRTFVAANGGELSVFGQYNTEGLSAKALLAVLVESGTRNGLPVTYKASGKSWVVVSGYDDDTIYYERYEFGANDVLHTMSLRYPVSERALFDPLVGPIANSLDGP